MKDKTLQRIKKNGFLELRKKRKKATQNSKAVEKRKKKTKRQAKLASEAKEEKLI
jgi:hypothetical protein